MIVNPLLCFILSKRIINHFIKPQFLYLGKGGVFFKPRYISVFGANVFIDDFPTLIGASDAKIQFTSWNIGDFNGEIFNTLLHLFQYMTLRSIIC